MRCWVYSNAISRTRRFDMGGKYVAMTTTASDQQIIICLIGVFLRYIITVTSRTLFLLDVLVLFGIDNGVPSGHH
jgi:hypothetical protein